MTLATKELRHHPSQPAVLCFSGHDPCGGAGIQADIETISNIGAHPTTIITALTIQNTQGVVNFQSCDAALALEQARTLLQDISVSVFKIGMIGSLEMLEAINQILQEYPKPAVVFDPILKASHGSALVEPYLFQAYSQQLLSRTTVLTPNWPEALALVPQAKTAEEAACQLLARGCQSVLITGTHRDTPAVINTAYHQSLSPCAYRFKRLPEEYHGSGCTLASAIAAYLALGNSIPQALAKAQRYSYQTLLAAKSVGQGQKIPLRQLQQRNAIDV